MNPTSTPAQQAVGLLTQERARYSAVITALAGIADNVPDAVKPLFADARAKINAALAGLPPLEQVAGAQDGNAALDMCAYAFRRQDELIANLSDIVGKVTASISGTIPKVAIAGEVEKGINEKLAKGELLTKDSHTALMGEQKKQIEAEFTARIQKRNDRRAKLATAGISAPADESRLDGEDAAFDTALDTAKTRTGEIRTALGLAGDAAIPAALSPLLWAEKAVFDGQMEIVKGAVAAKPSTQTAQSGDPTLGTQTANKGAVKALPI